MSCYSWFRNNKITCFQQLSKHFITKDWLMDFLDVVSIDLITIFNNFRF